MTTKTLAGPKLKTALPGPNAKRILAGDEKYLSPSYTRSYPLVARQGRGIVITDVDGNEFFDFSAPAWLTPPVLPDQPTNGVVDRSLQKYPG